MFSTVKNNRLPDKSENNKTLRHIRIFDVIGYVEPSKISVQFESSRNNIFGVLLRNNVDGKFEGQ